MILPCSTLALCLVAQQVASVPEDSLLQAVHDAFVSNAAAFPFGHIEFTYIQGSASDSEAARRGDFDPRYTATGLYVFDRERSRYERVFPEEEMRQSNTYIGSDIISILDSFRMATDGERTLYDSMVAKAGPGLARGITLSPGRRDFDRDFRFPISLGQPDHTSMENLGKFLRDAFRGEPDTRIAEVESDFIHEDRRVIRIVIEMEFGDFECLVDLERGAVPLRIVGRTEATDTSGESRTIINFDDLRLIPNRGWLPFKQSWWRSRDGGGGQIAVRAASFDTPPATSAFGIDFPKPTAIIDNAKGLRYPPKEVWNLSSLPSPGSPGVEKVEYASIPLDALPKLPGERTAGSRYSLLILGLIALAATIALFVWTRRRSHA